MFQLFYQSHALEIFGSAPEPADVVGNTFVAARLAQRGLRVSHVLFNYYSVADYHWITRDYNRLRSIRRQKSQVFD